MKDEEKVDLREVEATSTRQAHTLSCIVEIEKALSLMCKINGVNHIRKALGLKHWK